MDPDYLDLFSGDTGTAKNQAALIAQAIRQRRAAGALGMVSGDPAMASLGKEFAGEGDRMEQGLLGAAQHRASQGLQSKHLDIQSAQMADMMRHRQTLEAQGQER